jgi:hypothetical protein
MTPAERSLLLALFRWARAEGGLEYGRSSWWGNRTGPRAQWWNVDYDVGDEYLTVWYGTMPKAKPYYVASVTQAVDLVVALGIAPPRFSTAYRAGWDAHIDAASGITGGTITRDEFRGAYPAVRR